MKYRGKYCCDFCGVILGPEELLQAEYAKFNYETHACCACYTTAIQMLREGQFPLVILEESKQEYKRKHYGRSLE